MKQKQSFLKKSIIVGLSISLFGVSQLYANVVLKADTVVTLSSNSIQSFNDQNYTIEEDATLILESGAILKDIDTLTINGTLDAQDDSSIRLKDIIDNGENGEMETAPYIEYITESNDSISIDQNNSQDTNSSDLNNSNLNNLIPIDTDKLADKNSSDINRSIPVESHTANEFTSNQSAQNEESQDALNGSDPIQNDSSQNYTTSNENDNVENTDQDNAVLGVSDTNEEDNSYIVKDVASFTNIGLLILIFVSSLMTLFFLRKEEKI